MISEKLKIVQEKISEKCKEANRETSEIKLIAVSKNFGLDDIQAAYNEGIRDFGENKAQELDAKFASLGNKIIWHFIGSLQRNKVRFVVNSAEYIHSVDSLLLASEINKYAGKINKIQKVLLQVKTSNEVTKSGIIGESEVRDIAFYCREFHNIELAGLMTIAPFTKNRDLIKKSFSTLHKLKNKLNAEGLNLKELSMGMTSDFDLAIEEGATMLRIGSAIFGERDYSKDWKEKL